MSASDGQLDRVREFVSDGKWHTLEEIATAVGGETTAISARLRDLRQRRFGRLTVERRPLKGSSRKTFEYRLPPDQTPDFSGVDPQQAVAISEEDRDDREPARRYTTTDKSEISAHNSIRRWIEKEVLVEGHEVECPSCTSRVKTDSRTFTEAFAYPLVLFVTRLPRTEPITADVVKTLDMKLDRWRDWTRLRYWNLIKKDGSRGYFVTQDGIDAVLKGKSVSQSVTLFRGKPLRHSAEQVTIEDVLGTSALQKLLEGRSLRE